MLFLGCVSLQKYQHEKTVNVKSTLICSIKDAFAFSISRNCNRSTIYKAEIGIITKSGRIITRTILDIRVDFVLIINLAKNRSAQ